MRRRPAPAPGWVGGMWRESPGGEDAAGSAAGTAAVRERGYADSGAGSVSGFFRMSKNSSAMPMQIAESATLNAGQW